MSTKTKRTPKLVVFMGCNVFFSSIDLKYFSSLSFSFWLEIFFWTLLISEDFCALLLFMDTLLDNLWIRLRQVVLVFWILFVSRFNNLLLATSCRVFLTFSSLVISLKKWDIFLPFNFFYNKIVYKDTCVLVLIINLANINAYRIGMFKGFHY